MNVNNFNALNLVLISCLLSFTIVGSCKANITSVSVYVGDAVLEYDFDSDKTNEEKLRSISTEVIQLIIEEEIKINDCTIPKEVARNITKAYLSEQMDIDSFFEQTTRSADALYEGLSRVLKNGEDPDLVYREYEKLNEAMDKRTWDSYVNYYQKEEQLKSLKKMIPESERQLTEEAINKLLPKVKQKVERRLLWQKIKKELDYIEIQPKKTFSDRQNMRVNPARFGQPKVLRMKEQAYWRDKIEKNYTIKVEMEDMNKAEQLQETLTETVANNITTWVNLSDELKELLPKLDNLKQ